jgi:hypothetical protein
MLLEERLLRGWTGRPNWAKDGPMAWWIAERGSAEELVGPIEVSEAAAKIRALALSERTPGTPYQVRYHANANAPTEVRWEALNGRIIEVPKDERMTPSERRIGVRHFACFPAHIARPDGEKRTAMIHDLSVSGALLVVRAQLKVGDVVSLQLYVTGDPDSRTRVTHARVVRVEPLEPGAVGIWSHRVAVQFDEELTDFQAEIAALDAHQRQLGLRP